MSRIQLILDPKHAATKLLVCHYHEKAGHGGQDYAVNELRQRFWIPTLRSAVRSAWNACQMCKNARAVPRIPEMGQLPIARAAIRERQFSHTGMDIFGPMNVTIRRRRVKHYGVMFKCLATRAIHQEIAASLTMDYSIMTIRRMIGNLFGQ